ncbi:MAG: D-alanyl-D-alanine carboxypeptidase [Clostridia bacterium]|nr:D-alanyl-D-alanine carboxypeptidase [Clostridia bacterium]
MLHRFTALLLCIALLFSLPLSPPALAENTEDTGNEWVDPTLPEDAIRWDETHPELLDADMLYASSAILIEASSGEVLFEKNADEIMYPASTTKILTGYIALQLADLENDIVTVSQNAIDLVPPTYQKVPLSAGEEVPIMDVIGSMLVRSGNEAANALAEHLRGNVDDFADLMNETAQMLGCSPDTHFTNPSGTHDPLHYTTVRDMALIARAAMKDERFRQIVRTPSYEMQATNHHPLRTVVGDTPILNPDSESYYYPDAIGVKTGFTNAAGYCYVGAARRGGIELISVIFYSSRKGRWTDTKKLLEYGFTQVETISPEALYALDPRSINVNGFSLEDSNHGEMELAIRARDEEKNMIIVGRKEKIDLLRENFSQVSSIKWNSTEFRAPIYAGDVLGTLLFYSESGETAEYDLIATRTIEARKNAPPTLEQIVAYTMADENPFPRFTWDLLIPPTIILIVLYMLLRLLFRRRKKKEKMPNIQTIKRKTIR